MKFIYCTCNISVLERVTQLLDEKGVRDYQIIEEATAKSVKGTPRFNSAVWPGYNAVISMQVSDDQRASGILAELKQFNREKAFNEDEFVTACSWTLEDYFFDGE